jgi:5-methylcytosine-specific restriction enzyme A
MPEALKLYPLEVNGKVIRAEKAFRKALAKRAESTVKVPGINLPTPGGTAENETLIFLTKSLWHLSTPLEQKKWWHPFGFDQPERLKKAKSSRMIVQFSRTRSGYSARLGAFFAADTKGTIYLVHSGKIGGGKKGVGRTAFIESLGSGAIAIELHQKNKVAPMLVAFCSAITSPDIVRDIEKFTTAVYRFKSPIKEKKWPKDSPQAKFDSESEEEFSLHNFTNDQLRNRIHAGSKPKRAATTINPFVRNSAVVVLVKRRANGACERCGIPAPFLDRFMNPFLECHHIKSLAEDGVDDETNAIALCPNCHREAHFSVYRPTISRELAKRLKKILADEKVQQRKSSI